MKKSKVFSKEEILDFLHRANSKDRFLLARKAIVTIGYHGGLRMAELRTLTHESVKPCPEGYVVDFKAAKQRLHVKVSR